MNKISLIKLLTTLLISLLSSPSLSEGISYDDLVERDGLHYKKFTDVPFTGRIEEGRFKGNLKSGKKKGPWVDYYKNGQLAKKVNYKNGSKEGPWVGYYRNGKLKFKGDFKNGLEEGHWIAYRSNGVLWEDAIYKNGNDIQDNIPDWATPVGEKPWLEMQ